MGSPSLGQNRDFTTLFDQLEGVALWTTTEPGSFDYISAGFEGIWGIPPEEVKADPSRLLDTIHPEDRARIRANIESSKHSHSDNSSEHGRPDNSYEGRVVQPDGSIRWVLTRQTLLRDHDGNVTEVVGLCTDITEQKRRERELELLNRVIRHDIRNDMAVVLGWAEMLEEHINDEGEEYLQNILASSEHVFELTKTVREYVETVVANEELPVEPVPLLPVLTTELSILEESFPEAELVVDDTLPDIEVAANNLLSSVFRNLLHNSIQHNNSDTPIVNVSSEAHTDNVLVRIADNGPGIPDDQKDVIFGKGEKDLDSPGSGIGLYLVHMLVTQYGGDVWAEDNDPSGTVFTVKLPRID